MAPGPGNALTGRLLKAPGSPAAGALVSVYKIGENTGNYEVFWNFAKQDTTNANGEYKLENLEIGEYSLEAVLDSLKLFVSGIVMPDTDTTINVQDSLLKGTGLIDGNIGIPGTDSAARFMVFAVGTHYSDTTDYFGNFTFESLPEGDFELMFIPVVLADTAVMPDSVFNNGVFEDTVTVNPGDTTSLMIAPDTAPTVEPCVDFPCDSLAVMAILDSNGLDTITVSSLIGTDTNGRIDTLYIGAKGLTVIPPDIGKLANLRILHAGGNFISSLPKEIGLLTNLTHLNLNENILTSLPPEIGQLINLKGISIEYNQITSLPEEIGQLSNLLVITLHDNLIESLPAGFGNLTLLTDLVLTNNQLTTLPPEIGGLTNLTLLGIPNNKLTSLPAEIGNLTGLTLLALSGGNQLSTLPIEITNLTNLQELFIDGNALCSLSVPIQTWIDSNSNNANWRSTQNCP